MRFQKRIIAAILIIFMSLPAVLSAEEKTVSSPPAGKKPGVVAVVNGAEISLDNFIGELLRMERLLLDTGRPLTAPQVTRLRGEALEGLVNREILYQESKKTVRVTDAEIAAELERLKDEFQSETDFAKASPSLSVQVERDIAIRKCVDTVYTSKAIVTDADIRSYYDSHRDSFRQPEQVKANYILIKVGAQWDEAKRAEAKWKIEDIRKKALDGQDFVLLARTYSEDATASWGGYIGYVRWNPLLSPIERALFALKPGEVSDVVETKTGYHLVKAMERKPEMIQPFEEVKDQLRALLKQEKGRQEANAAIANARQGAKIEIFPPSDEE